MGMTMPTPSCRRLTSCCLCLSLRTGSLIVGGVTIIISLIGLISSIYCIYEGEFRSGPLQFFGVILLVICIFFVGVNFCLIHGVRTGNPCLMNPWILMTVLWLILVIGLTISNVASSVFEELKNELGTVSNYVVESVIGVITLLVTIYMLLVICSQKKIIEEETNMMEDIAVRHQIRGMTLVL